MNQVGEFTPTIGSGEKIPVSVLSTHNGTHFGIDVTKPENWGTFDDAVAAIGQPCFIKSSNEHFHIAVTGGLAPNDGLVPIGLGPFGGL